MGIYSELDLGGFLGVLEEFDAKKTPIRMLIKACQASSSLEHEIIKKPMICGAFL